MTNSISPAVPPSAGPEQWLQQRLRIRPHLRFQIGDQKGETVYLIEDRIRNKFFSVGIVEFHLIQRLDGQRTVAEAIADLQSTMGDRVDDRLGVSVCQWLLQSGLIQCDHPGLAQRLADVARQFSRQSRLAWLNPLMLRIPLCQPDAWLQRLKPFGQWLFSRWAICGWAILCLIALNQIVVNWQRIGDETNGFFTSGDWFWIFLGWVLLKVIHEVAHGIACKKYGGHVGSAGVQLILFAPLAYVDVTSSWRFRSRWQRIIVAAAGMYVELLIAFAALLVWANCAPSLWTHLCLKMFVMSGLTTLLFNANPLMRFDGYYILADLLDIPNLYTRSQQMVKEAVWQKLTGLETPIGNESRTERMILMIYGVCSIAWRLLLSIGILLIASTLLHGAGIILAAIGLVMWYGPVLARAVRSLRQMSKLPIRRSRLAVSAATIALLCFVSYLVLAMPSSARAPCVVQFQSESVVRAAADGQVTEVYVEDGAWLQAGDPILQLENPDLEIEWKALETKAAQLTANARRFQAAGELARYQAAANELDSVRLQLLEKQSQLAELRVCAPADGYIDRSQLQNLIGTYVQQGDAVAIVSQQTAKEVKVSFDQSQLQAVTDRVGHPVKILLPGTSIVKARLTSVDPRATLQSPSPTMLAPFGGPLAVRMVDDSKANDQNKYELVAPRLTGTIELDADHSSRLHAGQLGHVVFRTHDTSLGERCLHSVHRWIREKLGQSTTIY